MTTRPLKQAAAATDPIVKSVTVPLDPHAAFELFTSGIDRWWPKATHSLRAARGDGAASRIRVEPRPGGRVTETEPDGTVADWATVTGWKPGEHFAMRWFVGRSPDEATLVDIRFSPVPGGTRVDLTHGGFDALGDQGPRICASYTQGWSHVLGQCFGGACANQAA